MSDTAGEFGGLVAAVQQRIGAAARARQADATVGRGAKGLLAWGANYLPAHFSRPASNMHRWLAGKIDAMRTARGIKLNLLGPRGGAKSTIGTLAFPCARPSKGGSRISGSFPIQSIKPVLILENIKAELLENGLLARDYPRAVGRGRVWRMNAIVLRNGVAIEAFGTGQRIRGRRRREHRPTLIICDDLQNDCHIVSAVQRGHSRDWFHGMLMKAGTTRTNVVNLATALHREALAMELAETPGWTSRIFKAIVPLAGKHVALAGVGSHIHGRGQPAL